VYFNIALVSIFP